MPALTHLWGRQHHSIHGDRLITAATANNVLSFGNDGSGQAKNMDLKFYGSAATSYALLDASADTLYWVELSQVFGHSAQVTVSDGDGTTNLIPGLQVLGAAKADSSALLAAFNTTDGTTVAPCLGFLKSGHATIGSNTIVATGEVLGEITWYGADGTDFETPGARIYAAVNGTPGVGDMPVDLLFQTTPDGSETLATRLTIGTAGAFTFAASTTPASVATATGTAAPTELTLTGGLGGNTTIATTGTGGVGSGCSLTMGAGGTSNSATTAATGGAGGAWVITTGAGGAAAVAGVTATGGASGAITYATGTGGAVSLAVSGTATGGASGALSLVTGTGGAVTATTGTNVGGASGTASFQSGTGGAASAATDTGGASGALTIGSGTGGTGDVGGASGTFTIRTGAGGAGGTTGGVSGDLALTTGNAGTGGNAAAGNITIIPGTATGTGKAGSVTIGRAGVAANGAGVRIAASRVILANKSTAAVDASASITATVTQILEAGIFTSTGTATITLPSCAEATGIVQGLPGTPAVGDIIEILVACSHATQVVTLAVGTGSTLFGIATTVAGGGNRIWHGRITAVTADSETITWY